MKFFLDTANLADIESILSLGIVSGITTNPSIISKEKGNTGFDLFSHYKQICSLAPELPVSVEVVSTSVEEMYAEAMKLASIADNVVVKIPCNTAGIETVSKLSEKEVSTNCTLVFSLTQAICAMRAGATFISPFIGRLEDLGQHGLELVEDCVRAKEKYDLPTEIICTSIRSINHINSCIRLGADIVTCTPEYFEKLMNHPLTDTGLTQFLNDFNAK